MGLFRKSAPPSAQTEEENQPVYLFRTPHAVDGAWVYQVIRGDRSAAQRFGILPWNTLPDMHQIVSDHMNNKGLMYMIAGITADGEWGKWNLPCLPPPVPGMVQALNSVQKAAYLELLRHDLTGEEQSKLSPDELKAYLDDQLRDVPMASWQKPDINGLREGDRVRLIADFNGDEVSYQAGATGTILIVNTAPSHIRLDREMGLHYVLMDRPESDRAIIMVYRVTIEVIPGRADVVISTDGKCLGKKHPVTARPTNISKCLTSKGVRMPRPGESVKVKCQYKYCGKDTWVKWGYPSNCEHCDHPVITP
jgi:hypothetical protein